MQQSTNQAVPIRLSRKNYLTVIDYLIVYGKNKDDVQRKWILQISQYIQSVLDKSPRLDFISISLNSQNWTTIGFFLREVCKDKGSEWVTWAQRLNLFIQNSIEASSTPPLSPPAPVEQKQVQLPASPQVETRKEAPQAQPAGSSPGAQPQSSLKPAQPEAPAHAPPAEEPKPAPPKAVVPDERHPAPPDQGKKLPPQKAEPSEKKTSPPPAEARTPASPKATPPEKKPPSSSVESRGKVSPVQTAAIVLCPECGSRVLPMADGTCPSCHARIVGPTQSPPEQPVVKEKAVAKPESLVRKEAPPESPRVEKSIEIPPPVKIPPPEPAPAKAVPAAGGSMPPPISPARVDQAQQKIPPVRQIMIPRPPLPPGSEKDHPGYAIDLGWLQKDPGANAIFLEAARLGLYRENAFRVLEMPVDANPGDLARRQRMVEMATNTGLPVPPGSGRALPLPGVSDSHALREALQRLRDPERRLVDEFFWFWPHTLNKSASDQALQALTRDKVETSVELWSLQEREQSEANVSVHNLAVLTHALALDLEEQGCRGPLTKDEEKYRDDCWAQAFKRWKILLDYENFWSRLSLRIRDLDDPRLTTGMARRMRNSLPLVLLVINAQLAVSAAERGAIPEAQRQKQLMLGSGFGQAVIDEALRRALSAIREMIKTLCRTAESDALADPAHANQVAAWLLEQTRPRLAVLECLLSSNHPIRDTLHGLVAEQLLSCQLTFAKKTENWEESLKILKQILLVLPAGVCPSIRTRVEENIQIVQGNLEYGRCWFCQKNKKDDTAVVEIKMHGEVTRKPFYEFGRSGTRIEWKYRTIQVPRCSTCKQAHAGQDKFAWMGAGLGTLVGAAGCIGVISSNSTDPTCGAVLVLAACAGIGAAIGSAVGKSRSPKGIRPMTATNDFPVIKELKAKGWQIGEKPPGAQ